MSFSQAALQGLRSREFKAVCQAAFRVESLPCLPFLLFPLFLQSLLFPRFPVCLGVILPFAVSIPGCTT